MPRHSRDPGPRLSKSKYMAGLQCHKKLWWEIHEPDAPELEPDAAHQFIFDQGHEVGRVAQTYVPGGVLIDVPHTERRRRLQETEAALRDGATVLYEPAFEHDGVLVVVDILERVRGGWNLIEVKSSTKVKPQHLPDVAVQTHVLRGAGLEVKRAELMHLNRECRYPDLSNLFEREDLTLKVEKRLGDIPTEVRAMLRMLRGSLPNVKIGPQCHDPYDCPFIGRCWPEPTPDAIGNLYRLSPARREQYSEEGYESIADLPDDADLNAIQERQRRAVRTGGLVVEPGLVAALEGLKRPLAFLDFETVGFAIPIWDGCRPYDQVPVQFSVHHRPSRGRVRHDEWLADGSDDPREALAMMLIAFTRGAKTIVAYNAPFERGCIRRLREHLPHHAAELDAIEARIVDLLPVVQDHLYHPRFEGSFGLKQVVPVLVPALQYDDLEVTGGAEASQMLMTLITKGEAFSGRERRRLRRELLKYCAMDTLALVKLHDKLEELARDSPPAAPGT